MDKEFITYNQQMRHLRDKKNIQCNGTSDKNILCREGYFNLVNGYKIPFTCGKSGNDHIYIGGTTLKQLHELKRFDDELRMLLLKYITRVEEEVRTLVGYKFDEVNNNGKIEWYSVDAYNGDCGTQEIVKVISNSYQQLQKSKLSYITHYFENHKQIPTWILVKSISFSTFIEFLEISKLKIKDDLCEVYGLKKADGTNDYTLLTGSLHWMRKVRNSCAHNERIYGIHRDNGRILASYFIMLPKSYSNDRIQKLFDLIVYMRYYLSNKDYIKFVTEIKKMLIELQKVLSIQPFNKVRADMGIKDLTHLDTMMSIKKNIEYNKF